MDKEKIKDIVDNLDFGMRCFIHSKSKEVIFIPDYYKHPYMDQDVFMEDNEEIENNFEDYIEIEGMDTHESFKVMEDFVETGDIGELREKLIQGLNRPKPFRNFKFIIDNSGPYREKWFKFKDKKLIDWVENQLREHGL